MNKLLPQFWAKTSTSKDSDTILWHPLVFHLLDVAACAHEILLREPESTRSRMANILGMPWNDAKPWILLIIACHDLGKACPGFQCKWENTSGLPLPKVPNTDINHAFVSQVVLTEYLLQQGWPEGLAELVADATGCHHGERASGKSKDKAEYEVYVGRGEHAETVRKQWAQARSSLLNTLTGIFKPSLIPDKQTLSGPDFMLLSGLTSFADWIGSNDSWFPFVRTEDCDDLSEWFNKRKTCAERELDAIGWGHRTPLSSVSQIFEQVFNFPPRPLQHTVVKTLPTLQEPSVLLIEAPMGEGKTEAAFFAQLEMQRRLDHRGLYVALPTKATGNAMFKRTLKFIREQKNDRQIDLQLVHGAALLNDTFQNLRFKDIHDPEKGGEIRAGEWFTNKKRALLSEYGVGTIDQAIVPILPVRHNFVRLWGLANRVIVFDEVHAYDAYTGTLLIHLIHWLLALGSSIVLLSATLPPKFRKQVAKTIHAPMPETEEAYPRLSVFQSDKPVRQTHFDADPSRRHTLQLQGIPEQLSSIKAALDEHLLNGGMGLALVNTVQRAQNLYCLYPEGETIFHKGQHVGKLLPDGTEVYLFHARFPADRRQAREDQALYIFGEPGERTGRKILIATQVVEQSLDLDFDLLVTDLAPIDLILQRAGRLWRHARGHRSLASPLLIVAGLAGDAPPSFGEPLWWGGELYREDFLISTWLLLRENQRTTITLPDEIDTLVEKVYEEQVNIPEALQERMSRGLIDGEGGDASKLTQANMAILGLPDDASWNDPGRFVLFDEDAPGVHRTLMAQTRLGKDSVVAIPMLPSDSFEQDNTPDFHTAKKWFTRSVSLSRKKVVTQLKIMGVPDGWKKSSLLRNCYPLILNEAQQWVANNQVRLDQDLGVVYERKEDE